MVRAFMVLFALGLVLGIACGVAAQDFPYSVPQAPEFDDRGNPSGTSPGVAPDRASVKRPHYPRTEVEEEKIDYRSVRPYAPQDGQYPPPARSQRQEVASPVQRNSIPRPDNYGSTQDAGSVRVNPEAYGPPPVRTRAAARPAQPQPEERPDCSVYPMIIAQSKSEVEMQMASRRYLTCLLQNGWNMEQARMHVISTIENTYRLTR
ncbi:MAG: hypothetical protein HY912_17250 [Desulfomonile tiedjei]|uniref:Uncharacterized protein n=1 Tax=Desulfomonile tiedjei TaxID=2358 RepID=A0A9D6V5S4_9BACT|nr:hypothetical protein [Desulfomonile tiedjei]